MSEVALHIGGRTYRVACAAGEEDRVARLGATIAEKLASMGNPSGPDAQNLLFAALLLADEVQEARDSLSGAEDAQQAATREAEAASAQVRRLEDRIADLEADLSRMKDAAKASAQALEEARSREGQLTHAVESGEGEAAELRSRVAELERAAEARPAPLVGSETGADISALAPALEHFAEMLEQCADKLESRATAS
ncbi:cell division protein ZapA [Tsuneonella sp. YG55]|uniref:Cell division protein ZapA n=1 Tax=Tsuneonella litorea TaxID=2976475 RepID=A0A9X2VZS0_9SPHN|nr:cell division protein ZapA [Tsuneonella litorea]MCT2558127.1 cell division protein ZapA [Tsuneonella litorea]